MPSAATVRSQVEATLAARIPAALTLQPRSIRPVTPTTIAAVDEVVDGLPVGAITEITGPECSGRTSFALSFLSGMTQAGKAVAWIDASNALQPESAAAAGVDLSRLLWVRCGISRKPTSPVATRPESASLPEKYFIPPPPKQGLHGGGCGGHPRNEVKQLGSALTGMLRPQCVDSPPAYVHAFAKTPPSQSQSNSLAVFSNKSALRQGPHSNLDHALRVADLLLQNGGFSTIVLDLAGIAPELSSRVPLATWFRYRAASERTQTTFLLLSQHTCAKSSAALVLNLQASQQLRTLSTSVFTGVEHRLNVQRQRFSHAVSNVIPMRKPPGSASTISSVIWESRAAWAGR